MHRRTFLQTLGIGAISTGVLHTPLAKAQDITPITVVQLGNFMCSNSRQVNIQTERMQDAAQYAKIGFRFAPVTWEHQSPWPARVYYAARNLYPAAEPIIRDAMFDGMQTRGLAFETMPQVLTYLMNSQLDVEATKRDTQFNLVAIAEAAKHEDIEVSMLRAIRLLMLSEAQILPAFVWLKDGEIVKKLSAEEAPNPTTLVSMFVKSVTES